MMSGMFESTIRCDLVLEPQLAALQPRDFELVAGRLRRQRADPLVELAMLGLQRLKIWRRDCRRSSRVALLPHPRAPEPRPLATTGGRTEPCKWVKTKRTIRDLLRGGDTGC